MWSSFVAVLRKEFLHIARDRGTLVLAISIPVFQMILFGFIDQTVRDLPLVVVDQDRSAESRLLADQLRATGTFRVAATTDDPREARAGIVAGRARAAIVIPPRYAADRGQGGAQLLFLIDGSDANATAQALAAVNGLVAGRNRVELEELVGAARAQPEEVRPLILFNPAGRTAFFIIPGLVAILLQLVAMVLAAMAIVRERERGTLEQLLVTPIDPRGLILGKLGPYLLIGIGEMLIVLVAMRYGFAIPIRGSLTFLLAMAIVYLFALLALGLFISSRATTQAQAQQSAQLFFLPSIFLSGYIFPIEGLPGPLRAIGQLLPATHMVAIMRGVVLRDAGPFELWRHVLALGAMGVALVWYAARRFSKVSA